MKPQSRFIEFNGNRLHYLEAGEGEPVLLLHGWPTSSFLWRNVMLPIAAKRRVIAPDLPGFGKSDKPLGARYDFPLYERALDGLMSALGLERTALAVHDLGGPVGVHWAIQKPERITRIAFLNTLLFPPPHWTLAAFLLAARLPLLRDRLASRAGLTFAMKLGMHNRSRLTDEVLEGVRAPFASADARKALLKAATDLDPRGMFRIRDGIGRLTCPAICLYGENDRILPDVARTMGKVKAALPQAVVTPIPGCGHFLQEDRPDEVGNHLAAFFSR